MSSNLNRNTLSEINELILAAKPDKSEGLGDLLREIGHNVEVAKDEVRNTKPASLEAVTGVNDADMILLHVFDKLDSASKVAVIRSGISAKTKLAEERLSLLEKHEAVKLRGWVAKALIIATVVLVLVFVIVGAFAPNSSDGIEAGSGMMSGLFEVMKLVFGNPDIS